MTSLDQSQLDRVADLLKGLGLGGDCPACGKAKVSLSRHLIGIPEYVASIRTNPQGAGMVKPTGETVPFVMMGAEPAVTPDCTTWCTLGWTEWSDEPGRRKYKTSTKVGCDAVSR